MSGESLVEQRAEREGLRTVRLTRHDVLSVLTGHPMMCSDDAGNEVAVRMFRTDEFIEVQRAAAEKVRREYGVDPPPMPRELAERLTEPVPDALIWGMS